MEHLVFTVLGPDRPGMAALLTEVITLSNCNILDCKMLILGEEFTGNFLVSGTWNAMVKLESSLETIERKEKLLITKQRTKCHPYPKDLLPYIVYVVARDRAGALNSVTSFFAEQQLNITELYAEVRPARKSGVMIMSLTLYVNVPLDTNISDLRERFIVFCDAANLDGMMEAEKGL